MPVARLANTGIVHGRGGLNEFQDFARGGARPKHGSNANGVERWAVVVGDDATTEDDDVVEASLSEFFADLWKEVGVGSGKRGKPKESSVFVTNGVNDLLRSPPQAGVDDLMPSVTESPCDHFGTTVMTVESWLRDHDTQRLVHDRRTRRFPINATLWKRDRWHFSRASNKGGLGREVDGEPHVKHGRATQRLAKPQVTK